jgi:hypothetical protein
MIYVTDARYVKNYQVALSFSNGEHAVIDLEYDVFSDNRVPFQKLRDLSYFQTVQYDPDCVSICWANGVDFAPDYLYHLAQKQSPVYAKMASSVSDFMAN